MAMFMRLLHDFMKSKMIMGKLKRVHLKQIKQCCALIKEIKKNRNKKNIMSTEQVINWSVMIQLGV